jgi:hypothetical protein
MFAQDFCHNQIEYLFNTIEIIKYDRAKPPARKGCNAYALESETNNLQFSIFNIHFRLRRFGFQVSGVRGQQQNLTRWVVVAHKMGFLLRVLAFSFTPFSVWDSGFGTY